MKQCKKVSIRKTVKYSYIGIIVMLVIPLAVSMGFSIWQTLRYDRIISNVSKINRLNKIVKTDITNEIWNIVAGSKAFFKGSQFLTISEITDELKDVENNTYNSKSVAYIHAAYRALDTLTKYITMLGIQMANDAPTEQNEQMLEEIRSVTGLVYDILQDFIINEIDYAAQTNKTIKRNVKVMIAVQLLLILSVIYFAYKVTRSVSSHIEYPIQELEKLSKRIAAGCFNARSEICSVSELDNLTANLNSMAGSLDGLIQENIDKQKTLQKTQMRAVQAQITPHFLYNTLDTIIDLAVAKKNDQVIDIARALSSFLHISVSREEEWITVGREFEHIRSYVTIQKICCRDIFEYTIESEPEMNDECVLKLMLQPLVENALYHGLKNKRGKGLIKVRGWKEGGSLCFLVEDNGMGMTDERLAEIKSRMKSAESADVSATADGNICGLCNVYRRLHLYYGDTITFEITSIYGSGTSVFFAVPQRPAPV